MEDKDLKLGYEENGFVITQTDDDKRFIIYNNENNILKEDASFFLYLYQKFQHIIRRNLKDVMVQELEFRYDPYKDIMEIYAYDIEIKKKFIVKSINFKSQKTLEKHFM